jgi:hypothetical protein
VTRLGLADLPSFACCGSCDEIGNCLWLGDEDRVATLYFDGIRLGALRHKPLRIWWNHLVFSGDEVPAALGPPGSSGHHFVERI